MGDLIKINLYIYFLGGDVFEGMVIYNLLCNYLVSVDVYIDGLVVSMVLVIVMVGDIIYMFENVMMMVYKFWGIQGGDVDDMCCYVELFDKVEDILVMVYVNKIGKFVDDIKVFFKEEIWMNG